MPVHAAHEEHVAAFLEYACSDANVRGPLSRRLAQNTAARILARHPEIAHDSLHTAAVCGHITEVHRILTARPASASASGGPRGWPPLLYLCNARVPGAAYENAVAIARALLDSGADPNARYILHGVEDYPYSALAGVVGRGEEEAPPHPYAEALARLLLERGAEPYDGQLLYNVFGDNSSRKVLSDEIVWLLDLLYVHSVRRGRDADWKAPEWPMLAVGTHTSGARFLLEAAVDGNHRRLAEWILMHGANPNAAPRTGSGPLARSLHELALRRGFPELGDLLERYGATPAAIAPEDESSEEGFVQACLRLDRDAAMVRLERHPEYLRSPRAMFEAAPRDRVDVVELLLGLGVSPDVEDVSRGCLRPLHVAAGRDAGRVAALLIDSGAEVDFREKTWNATPLGWAVYGMRSRAIDALSRASRDVFNLAFAGRTERLRQLLTEEPELSKSVDADGETLLMSLPDDEAAAAEVVELLLSYGADPAVRTDEGLTAADIASRRWLHRAADLLRSTA